MSDEHEYEEKFPFEVLVLVMIAVIYAITIAAASAFGIYKLRGKFLLFVLGQGQLFSWVFWAFLLGGVFIILFAIDEYKKFKMGIPQEADLFVIKASAILLFDAIVFAVAWFVTHVNWGDF